MSSMGATDAMDVTGDDLSGSEQEETVAPMADTENTAAVKNTAEAAEISAEAPNDGAGEETTDNTEGEGEPAVPAADEGDTAEQSPHEEGEVQSATNTITDEPADWSELCAVYPNVDPALVEQDASVRALLRGEVRPTPRQAYEITHLDAIVEARVAEQVAEQVAHAVRESEARLLDHIRTCGQRPVENGVRAAVGVRMHPAVGRLTRSDRAALAKRAQRGETIRL